MSCQHKNGDDDEDDAIDGDDDGGGDGDYGDNDGNGDDDENALFPLQLLGAGMRMASHIPPLSCTISSAKPPSYTP